MREILVLTEEFYPTTSGGAHTQWQFCKKAADKDTQVTVITPRNGNLPSEEVVEDVAILRPFRSEFPSLPTHSNLSILSRGLYSILIFIYAANVIRRQSINGVFSGTHAMHWVAKTLSQVFNIPLVSYVSLSASTQSDDQWSVNSLFEYINFRFFMGTRVLCRTTKIAERVRELNNSEVDVLQGFLHNRKIRDAADENAHDTTAYKQRDSEKPCKYRLVYVGRLVPIKNPVGAIRTVTSLPEGYELVIVGDGPQMTTVQAAVDQMNERDRIRVIGDVDHETALKWIATSHALLITSDAESLCGVALEALALRTTVISTPVGILPDLDHSNLHLGELDELPEVIRNATLNYKTGIDERILFEFSMNNYTRTVLEAFRNHQDSSASQIQTTKSGS